MPTERENIEAARAALLSLEKNGAAAVRRIVAVAKENAAAGRAKEANEAFMVAAELEIALGNVKLVHGRGTRVLLELFPQYEGIVTAGPGR